MPAKRAALVACRPGQCNRLYKPNITAYEKLLTKVEIDGQSLVAVYSIERHADGRQFFNAVTLEDGQEKTPVASPRDTPEQVGERATSANTGVNSFRRQPLRRVNPDSVSKVVDPQTGEPLVMYHGTDANFSIFRVSRGDFGDGI